MDDDPYGSFKEENRNNLTAVLRSLADELIAAEAYKKEIEQQLEVANNLVKDLSENRIPSAAEGLEGKFDIGDGLTLILKEEIRASIAGDKKVPAIKWLDDNDYGHIVKRQLVFEFGKDDQDRFDDFIDAVSPILLEQRIVLKENFTVHPQTLVAFVREKLGEGVQLPKDVFGIFRQRIAKVKE